MKITIENTEKIVNLDGVPARLWEGQSETGVNVICYVTRIAVAEGENHEQFRKELNEQRAPSPEVEAIPLRLII